MFDPTVFSSDSFLYLLGYALMKYLPLAVLCYIPFLHCLRMKKHQFYLIFFIVGSITCLGLALCYEVFHWSADAGLMVFASLGLIILSLTVRASIPQLLFVFLMVMHYGSLHHDFTYFALILLDWPQSYNLPAFVVAYLVTIPPLILVMVKGVRPAIEKNTQPEIWRVVWIVPIAFFAAQFGINTGEMSLPSEIVAAAGLTIGSLASYYFIFKIVDEMAQNAILNENLRATDKILSIQAAQYEILMERIEAERQTRHDIRHHMHAIAGLLAQKQYANLAIYLEQYIRTLPEYAETVYCENSSANALAAYYLNRARLAGASIDAVLDIPAEIGIAEADLSVVLGNLLENAAEAVEKMGGGSVRVRSQILGDEFVLTVDNHFEDMPVIQEDEFLSSKHKGIGVGITSVRATVQRYGGEARFEVMGNTFQASVRLTMHSCNHKEKCLE